MRLVTPDVAALMCSGARQVNLNVRPTRGVDVDFKLHALYKTTVKGRPEMNTMNIEACLEDLENRIDPAVEDRLQGEWEAFTEGRFDGDIFSPGRSKQIPPRIEWRSIAATQSPFLLALVFLADPAEPLRGDRRWSPPPPECE